MGLFKEWYLPCSIYTSYKAISHCTQGPEKMGVDFQFVSSSLVNQLYQESRPIKGIKRMTIAKLFPKSLTEFIVLLHSVYDTIKRDS